MKRDSNHPTRREFLVATGLALSASVSGLAAADAPEPISVVVIGSGGRGCDLIRRLTTVDAATLTAVCDDYPPHLERGLKYAGPQAKGYSDYKKMFEEVRPRAVVVAVPLWLHFQVCMDALEAGCDVFCEKTMCYSIEEARKLADKVASLKRVFQVGLQRRSNPIYQQARAMIQSGMIGRISAIKSQWHRNNNWRRPVPVARGHADWDKLEKKLNWRLYKKYSQGLMAELGSHQMDVANWMLNTLPQRVTATGGIDYWRDGRDVNDNVWCIYEYQLKPASTDKDSKDPYTVRVTYSSLCNNAYEGASETIFGTKGTLILTDRKGFLYPERGPDDAGWVAQDASGANASIVTSGKTLGLSNDPWSFRGKPVEIENLAGPGGDDTRSELVSFIDCVRNKNVKTVCDARSGLHDAATILIANQAIDSGKTVEFPKDLL